MAASVTRKTRWSLNSTAPVYRRGGRRGAAVGGRGPRSWYAGLPVRRESCPQEVDFTEVVFALRNLAVRKGLAPPGLGAARNLLEQQGRMYEVTDFENEKRKEMGLPEIKGDSKDIKNLLKD